MALPSFQAAFTGLGQEQPLWGRRDKFEANNNSINNINDDDDSEMMVDVGFVGYSPPSASLSNSFSRSSISTSSGPDSDFEFDIHSDSSSNASHISYDGSDLDLLLQFSSTGSDMDESLSDLGDLACAMSDATEAALLSAALFDPASPATSPKSSSSSSSSSKARYACPECPRAFASRSQLGEHRAYRHSSARAHKCVECGKTFKSVSNLNQHLRTHAGPSVGCPLCGKVLSESGWRYHALVHSNQKPFACSFCPQSFLQNKLLKKHVSSCHSTARNFGCAHCAASFKRKDHLQRHVADTHAANRVFRCASDGCDATFPSARMLQQHGRAHRESRTAGAGTTGAGPTAAAATCAKCHKTFRWRKNLTAHMLRSHGVDSAAVSPSSMSSSSSSSPPSPPSPLDVQDINDLIEQILCADGPIQDLRGDFFD